jgi:hypothetical protein
LSIWKDTKGNRIEAHGGGFLKVGDTWYWFGEWHQAKLEQLLPVVA